MEVGKRLRCSLLLSAFVGALTLFAQGPTVVEMRSYSFSNGVHPTFAVVHTDTDQRTVEAHWRDVIKNVSSKVTGKKELIGMAALVSEISPDTIRILMKSESVKSLSQVTVHIAFLTTRGYVGTSSDSSMVRSARAFVYRHALALRMELANKELALAERYLKGYERDLAMLQRELERAEGQLARTEMKDSTAVLDQARTKEELRGMETDLANKNKQQDTEPDVEAEEDLKDMQKAQRKVQGQHDKAVKAEQQAIKRSASLEETIRRNKEAQVKKEQQIERQRAHVEELREKVKSIH